MKTEQDITGKNLRDSFVIPLLFAKGVAMGLGDSVPGVSGGTIAVITNIYERLIVAIKSCDLRAVQLLLRGEIAATWRHVDGNFLVVLALGILSGLLLSANTVLYLLENHVEPLMAFFCGLVLASAAMLRHEFDAHQTSSLAAIVVGILVALAVGLLSPQSIEVTMPYLFIAGMVAICAMILPGLSGAYLLLMFGVYEFVLTALVQFQVLTILVFASGCLVGILSFSRVLAWMLSRYYQLSYGVITGMLLGSVGLLWPWQETLSTYTDSAGVAQTLQSRNILPLNYTEATGSDPLLLASVISFLVGIAAVFLLRWLFSESRARRA